MQYSILVNQTKALEWGLNLSESVLFSVVINAPNWATEKIFNDQAWYWIANSKLASELPLLTDKPDTVKRLMRSLEKKGLILRRTDGQNSYIKITEKGKGWLSSGGEKYPTHPGKNIPPTPGNISPQSYNQLSNNHNTKANVELKPDPPPKTKLEAKSECEKTKTAKNILETLNLASGKSFRPVASNINLIKARLAEGATPDDFASVINRKCQEWLGDPKMSQYLRPKTLFNATNFNNYLGDLDSPLPQEQGSKPEQEEIDWNTTGWIEKYWDDL